MKGVTREIAIGTTLDVLNVSEIQAGAKTSDSWTVEHISCGWPLLCLEGERWATGWVPAVWENRQVLFVRGALFPYRPRWFAFTLNSLFLGMVACLLMCGPFALRRYVRRLRGLCPACAYPIGTSPVCTECGETIPRLRQRSVEPTP